MAASPIRTILPLSIVTGASMLAMDLYLPAVPTLQRSFAVDVTLAQATVPVFLVGLAASQLLWAEARTRLGPLRSVQLGVGLLAIGGAGCALAPTIDILLGMRLLQGVAAGAATVVAPSVVRATLSEADAVRGIAAISRIEALVPAAGPVLGAAMLLQLGWRGLFWALAAISIMVLPFVVRVTPLPAAFPTLQVLGVAAFIVTVSQSARLSARLSARRTIHLGAFAQTGLSAALLALALVGRVSFTLVPVYWCAFCGALAVRGPTTFSEALAVPPAQMGRASALLVLGILLSGALGTQVVAPFMDGRSAAPLAAGVLALSIVSSALVVRYREREALAPAEALAPL